MKLYYLKREKGRNEILETNISDRLYHSDNFAALLERICQHFRVSASVILLPVLIMTVGSQIHTMTICTVTSVIVFYSEL